MAADIWRQGNKDWWHPAVFSRRTPVLHSVTPQQQGGGIMARTDGLYRRGEYWYFKFKSADSEWCERATRSKNYQDAKRIRTQFLSDLQEGKLPNKRASWKL